jgi:hypothetical protein
MLRALRPEIRSAAFLHSPRKRARNRAGLERLQVQAGDPPYVRANANAEGDIVNPKTTVDSKTVEPTSPTQYAVEISISGQQGWAATAADSVERAYDEIAALSEPSADHGLPSVIAGSTDEYSQLTFFLDRGCFDDPLAAADAAIQVVTHILVAAGLEPQLPPIQIIVNTCWSIEATAMRERLAAKVLSV